jgi:MFS family permease
VAALALGAWRLAFLPVALLLAVVGVLLHRWSRQRYRVESVALEFRATLRRLVASTPVRRSLVAFGLVGFVWQGGVNFVPTLLQVERGLSPSLASGAFAALFVVGAVVNPVAGGVGDRVGYPTVAAAGLLVATAGLALLVAVPTRAAAVVGVGLFGVGVSAFWPVMDAFVLGQLPDGSVGGDFGALNTANLVVGSLGPTYVGVVAERAGYVVAFAGFAVPFLAAVVVLLALRRSGAR